MVGQFQFLEREIESWSDKPRILVESCPVWAPSRGTWGCLSAEVFPPERWLHFLTSEDRSSSMFVGYSNCPYECDPDRQSEGPETVPVFMLW